MSKKKDVRQIKLELKGDLKELIENDASSQYRNCTQQVYFILDRWYKGELVPRNSLKSTNEELLVSNSESKELYVQNSEKYTQDSEEYVPYSEGDSTTSSYEDEPKEDIDPAVLDF